MRKKKENRRGKCWHYLFAYYHTIWTKSQEEKFYEQLKNSEI